MATRLPAFVLAAVIPLSACGSGSDQAADIAEAPEETTHENHAPPSGDLQEATASKTALPSFLNGHDDNMRAVYLAAAEHAAVLAQIPCYCGCGESAGHQSSLNCFVSGITESEVIWDDHGTRCGVCLDIAATTAVLTEKGQSPKEIRTFIDRTYSEGYAKPTPTPMPGA